MIKVREDINLLEMGFEDQHAIWFKDYLIISKDTRGVQSVAGEKGFELLFDMIQSGAIINENHKKQDLFENLLKCGATEDELEEIKTTSEVLAVSLVYTLERIHDAVNKSILPREIKSNILNNLVDFMAKTKGE